MPDYNHGIYSEFRQVPRMSNFKFPERYRPMLAKLLSWKIFISPKNRDLWFPLPNISSMQLQTATMLETRPRSNICFSASITRFTFRPRFVSKLSMSLLSCPGQLLHQFYSWGEWPNIMSSGKIRKLPKFHQKILRPIIFDSLLFSVFRFWMAWN